MVGPLDVAGAGSLPPYPASPGWRSTGWSWWSPSIAQRILDHPAPIEARLFLRAAHARGALRRARSPASAHPLARERFPIRSPRGARPAGFERAGASRAAPAALDSSRSTGRLQPSPLETVALGAGATLQSGSTRKSPVLPGLFAFAPPACAGRTKPRRYPGRARPRRGASRPLLGERRDHGPFLHRPRPDRVTSPSRCSRVGSSAGVPSPGADGVGAGWSDRGRSHGAPDAVVAAIVRGMSCGCGA